MDIQAEVKKIKEKIAERSRPKSKALSSGDRGQRFAVMARLNGGEPLCLGWSERADGGQLGQAALIHPEWTDLRIIDRDPRQQRSRVLKMVTCRKCVEQFDAGRDRCEYCNNLFTTPFVVGKDVATGESIQVIMCGHCKAVLLSLEETHECGEKLAHEEAKADAVNALADERRGNEKFVARQDKAKAELAAKEGSERSGGLTEKART